MSGVLHTKPLVCRANESGEFGKYEKYAGCAVGYAMFVFLHGAPDENFPLEKLKNQPLVCLTSEWEDFLLKKFPDIKKYTRWHMKPRYVFDFSKVRPMPEDYKLKAFGAAEFEKHPFEHGMGYPDAAEFEDRGVGAVVYHGDEIVSSASSFITFKNEVELDVSSSPEHRRKHLAENCVSEMLRQCARRGIMVHWDAQNIQSRKMGEKFGFEVDQEYICYWITEE